MSEEKENDLIGDLTSFNYTLGMIENDVQQIRDHLENDIWKLRNGKHVSGRWINELHHRSMAITARLAELKKQAGI